MHKKGQITVFIIIGIVLLAAISSAVYFFSYRQKAGEFVPLSMQQIKLFTDECLRETAEGAILLSGAQGGVIYFGDVLPNVETSYSYSTYWYDSGEDLSVSRIFIESEISKYIEEEIVSRCINNFESLHMNIAAGNISSVEVSIKPGYIDLSLNMPVTLIEGNKRTTISKFSTQLPVKLGQSIEIAKQVVQMEIKDPDNVRLSDLGDMEMLVIPYKYSDDIMIYTVIDEQNKVKGMNFKLVFANRFGTESSGNRDPKIINANNLLFIEGIDSQYQFVAFDADNDNLTWSSSGVNPHIIVDKKGILRFKPTATDLGNSAMDIIVEDGKGGRDVQNIKTLVVSR